MSSFSSGVICFTARTRHHSTRSGVNRAHDPFRQWWSPMAAFPVHVAGQAMRSKNSRDDIIQIGYHAVCSRILVRVDNRTIRDIPISWQSLVIRVKQAIKQWNCKHAASCPAC